ncbi:hypothetical protein AN477_11820 [Alicyclobacillus ferrooxydans]|uniref:Endonuclease n=1 Tax=Alicyclobacillus ferrooxydans TaxID=471514 RepID=A0A0P9GRG3_9BACL|nr:hypothetical protein AN477_11820 [Alicyclobacillus ferrooxydans]
MKAEDGLFSGARVTAWLLDAYKRLETHYGDLHWWPAQTVEEMVIGAILVQNVAWKNTQKALSNLDDAGLMSFSAIYAANIESVAEQVVPTRFYNMKAKRLKSFAEHLINKYDGELTDMLSQPLDTLREELLSIPGIGPETADDIVLYGAGLPSFVVDAYTKRILFRCGVIPERVDYEELRQWFMKHLPADPAMFNQFHALLDRTGNRCCLAKKPRCLDCALQEICQFASDERRAAERD